MSWKRLSDFTRTLSFRLNLWHAAIFLVSAVLLFTLIYFLLGRAIDRKDRDVIQARLREYLAVYENGGAPALHDWTSRINEARRQQMFFVRVAGLDQTILLLVMPQDWFARDLTLVDGGAALRAEAWMRIPRDADVDLTVASTFLPDGTIFQVGRSSDSRSKLLANFRELFAIVIVPVILLGFIGGALLTNRAMQPIRGIVNAASSIINTGRMDVRVPTRAANDELQNLVILFNKMLEYNERLVGALRESLDNVAHDLRTPLARLRATLESGARERSDLTAAEDKFGAALEETDRVNTIISTLMDVAQAEAGLMKLHRAPADVGLLIDDVMALYEQVAEEKEIAITKNFTPPLIASVDAARLRQVFANLLDNAIKYTPVSGKIVIAAQCHDRAVVVVFWDTGSGIADVDLPRIWERLYRGDKSRSEHGLGLGLSLVKAIVGAHRGRVEVTSKPGEGSEFRIYLPVT